MDSWSMPTHSHRSPSRSTSVPYRQPSVLTGMNNDIISAVSAGTNRDTWKNALHLLKAVRGDVPTVNVSERIFPGSSGGLGKVPFSPGISPHPHVARCPNLYIRAPPHPSRPLSRGRIGVAHVGASVPPVRTVVAMAVTVSPPGLPAVV